MTQNASPADQSPQELLDAVLKDLRRLGADGADARLSQGAGLSVEVRNGKLEGVERDEGRSLSIRALVGRRQAQVSGSDLSPDGVRILCERVTAMAASAPEDKWAGVPGPDEIERDVLDLGLETDDQVSAEVLEERAREAEAAALAVAGVKQASHAGAGWNTSETTVAASNGFMATTRYGMTSMTVVAIAEQDGAMERDYESRYDRLIGALPSPAEIGRIAGTRAAARLGARKIDSCTAPVIFDNRLSSRLVSALVGAISGPAVARGVSFLKEKMGQQVFARGVNVIDDPLLPGALGSRAFDGEGRPVKRTALIEDGTLTQWLLNGPSARQLGLTPNGFASYGFGDPPGVSTSNLTLEPGRKSLDALMADAGEGLLVTDMFGPSLNPNNGDYSVGVSGFWFQGGVRVYPVTEVTVAGDLTSMFLRLVPGSDLDIRGATNAPSLLIDGMTLAGR